jgi:hypothetical protein
LPKKAAVSESVRGSRQKLINLNLLKEQQVPPNCCCFSKLELPEELPSVEETLKPYNSRFLGFSLTTKTGRRRKVVGQSSSSFNTFNYSFMRFSPTPVTGRRKVVKL